MSHSPRNAARAKLDRLFPQTTRELSELRAWLRDINAEGQSLVGAMLTYLDAERGGLVWRQEYAGLACAAAEALRKTLGRWEPAGWSEEVRETFFRPFSDLYEAAERLAVPETFSIGEGAGDVIDRFEAAYRIFARMARQLDEVVSLVLGVRSGAVANNSRVHPNRQDCTSNSPAVAAHPSIAADNLSCATCGVTLPSDRTLVRHEKKRQKESRRAWNGRALDCANAFKKMIDDGDWQPLKQFCVEFSGSPGGHALYATLTEHRDKWDPEHHYKAIRRPRPAGSCDTSCGIP